MESGLSPPLSTWGASRSVTERWACRTHAEGVAKATGLSLPSAYKLIGDIEVLGILEAITGAKRGRIYRFEPYGQIFGG